VTSTPSPLPPAYYASAARAGDRRPLADWWDLLHPPYTLWHLAYVAIGASVTPRFDGGTLAATLLAFFLAVGVCAHALDELQGRPLRTRIPGWQLVAAASLALALAVALGVAGTARVGAGLVVFIVLGVVLTCGYNLELFGGRLHNDVTFAAAWGAFPVLTAAYAQARTIGAPATLVAVGCFLLSNAQRRLSTPARALRRRLSAIEGELSWSDGRRTSLSVEVLLAPLEAALRALARAIVALAVGLVMLRLTMG
jgi:hypothetical protein